MLLLDPLAAWHWRHPLHVVSVAGCSGRAPLYHMAQQYLAFPARAMIRAPDDHACDAGVFRTFCRSAHRLLKQRTYSEMTLSCTSSHMKTCSVLRSLKSAAAHARHAIWYVGSCAELLLLGFSGNRLHVTRWEGWRT